MGNELFVGSTKFQIEPNQEQAATQALRERTLELLEQKASRSQNIQEVMSRIGLGVSLMTLDQLVESWGWSLARDLIGNTKKIVDIHLLEDFSSDEEELFATLAPFVKAGSYIDLEGNGTGGHWTTRYYFTGSKVVELEPAYSLIPANASEPPIPEHLLTQISEATHLYQIENTDEGTGDAWHDELNTKYAFLALFKGLAAHFELTHPTLVEQLKPLISQE